MDIAFIEARRTDIDTLLDLMAEYYAFDHIPYDRREARAALEGLLNDRTLGGVWLIRAGGEIAGYCVLTLWYSLEFRGRTAFVDELFVREGFRAKGIGTQALAFLADTAWQLGAKALRLEVERKNVAAKRLYGASGFETEERDLMTKRLA